MPAYPNPEPQSNTKQHPLRQTDHEYWLRRPENGASDETVERTTGASLRECADHAVPLPVRGNTARSGADSCGSPAPGLRDLAAVRPASTPQANGVAVRGPADGEGDGGPVGMAAVLRGWQELLSYFEWKLFVTLT